MVFELHEISGLGEYVAEQKTDKNDQPLTLYRPEGSDKAFLVVHNNTLELRTDQKLGKLLAEKYESVMKSRYFGKAGIEIVLSGQLTQEEIDDLIRLSYNMTKQS